MFKSKRTFKLWAYSVSHNQMVIRSPKSHDSDLNIDIAFAGVRRLCLTTKLQGIALREATAREVSDYDCDSSARLFLLESEGNRNWVFAASCKVYENTLDLFESGLEPT